MMARMSELSRRAILRLGVGAAAGAAGAYALGTALRVPSTSVAGPPVAMTSAGAPLAPPPPLEPPPTAAPTYVDGSFVSAARGGVPTNWAIARPPGQTTALRAVIALHGKGQDAAGVMAGGVEGGLAQAVAAGIPPFAVVAVDGGGGYWHKRADGEDSGTMVLNELIPMLSSQGLDTSRVGFLGWSMGGYGALLLGARLGPARTAAICAVSPALWTSSGAAAPGAFDGACLNSARFPSGSIAATAIRSIRRPNSSSPSCPAHRPAASPPADMTAGSGAPSCRRRSPGWLRW
jgi:S-formylglutathione hydrolase FrmB